MYTLVSVIFKHQNYCFSFILVFLASMKLILKIQEIVRGVKAVELSESAVYLIEAILLLIIVKVVRVKLINNI